MTDLNHHNGHHANKIKLSAEQKKELTVISAGLNTNLIKIEQLLTKINTEYNQTKERAAMAKLTNIQKKRLQKIRDDLNQNFLKFELLMNEAGQMDNSTWNNMSGTLSLAIDELENCLDE